MLRAPVDSHLTCLRSVIEIRSRVVDRGLIKRRRSRAFLVHRQSLLSEYPYLTVFALDAPPGFRNHPPQIAAACRALLRLLLPLLSSLPAGLEPLRSQARRPTRSRDDGVVRRGAGDLPQAALRGRVE